MTTVNYLPFPERLRELRGWLPELLQILQSGREADWYAFVALEETEQQSATVANTETLSAQTDRGVVMRAVVNARNYERSTNKLDRDSLLNMARAFRAELDALTIDKSKPVYAPLPWADEDLSTLDPVMRAQIPAGAGPGTQVHFGTPVQVDPSKTNLAEMAALCRSRREAVLARDPKPGGKALATAGALIRQKIRSKAFVDRERNISQCLLTTMSYVFAVSPQGRMARRYLGGLGGFETAQITDADIDYIAGIPHKLDAAERLSPGRYKIITSPDVTGVIAHEAFGHTQEGDTRRLGRSCAVRLQREGVKVGVEQASIVNNPAVFSMEGAPWGQNGSHFFDDEGQLARPHVILDRGVVTTPMNDLLSALVGDANGRAPRQSNGKRESWRNPIMARQTNTYFTAGDKSLNELIGMVDDGFLAGVSQGGMEDPKGMGLTAGAAYLEEIKNGKLTGRVFLGPNGGHIELSDPVPKILKGLIAKSKVDGDNIPPVEWGGCAKYHKELVEAGCGGPYILWQAINCG